MTADRFPTLPASQHPSLEYQRAEAALRASERRCRILVENSWDATLLFAPDGRILYCSPAISRMLGYPSEELIDQNALELIHPADLPSARSLLTELLRQPGASQTAEYRFRHRDGSWRWVESIGTNLLHEPSVKALVSHCRDVTERKQLEERLRQSQKMEAVGRLAGGVAHDFNNMIGAITGYADLLLHRLGSDEAVRGPLQEIMKAAERASMLTRQLLLFSRKEMPAPQVVDLGELVEQLHKMLRRLIGEDIELVTITDPAAGRVKADPGQIEQVLLNLVVNARDAMPQGGKLTIALRDLVLAEDAVGRPAGVEPGAYVVLEVSDSGCGMDAETMARIFEPFFTTKERGKGTGLGLATVYAIVERCGGQIRVDSAPGQGTIFRIYLPRTEEAGHPPAAPDLPVVPSHGSETILLAEDESILRGLVREVLQLNGYTVLEAIQGDEALCLCERHNGAIDLLVSDVVMPGMGGRELAERARALRPGLKVLLMSGYTDDALVRHGARAGDMTFIQKPFRPDALARRIRELLEAAPPRSSAWSGGGEP